MERLTLLMMIRKVIQLQELVKEKKAEYMAMQGNNDVVRFSEGVAAACTFFERVLEDILGTREELEKLFRELCEKAE